MSAPELDVAIVGGGPVGLFLGLCLGRQGLRFRILEQLESPIRHTRSIGIHPPALELMAILGIADPLIARGIPVAEGLAFGNRRPLGSLSFSSCPAPFRFVLSIPQYETESVLEETLESRSPGALIRGARVDDVCQDTDAVRIAYRQAGASKQISARFVVACDGKDSVVRKDLGIPLIGARYEDTYVMGDFPDDTRLGPRAAIFLTDDGLVESFPLPDGIRRWVAKTFEYIQNPTDSDIRNRVRDRTGHHISSNAACMLSAFGVQHYLSARFVQGRVLLAGDAAHTVSPIGGQGMNLGWLDAAEAAKTLFVVVTHGHVPGPVFSQYQAVRRRAAVAAIRRAKFNMQMGRTSRFPALKYAAVATTLHSPLRHMFARLFTMRGL